MLPGIIQRDSHTTKIFFFEDLSPRRIVSACLLFLT